MSNQDHIVDDKGNKWLLVTIFNHDIQESITVLQPYSEDDTEGTDLIPTDTEAITDISGKSSSPLSDILMQLAVQSTGREHPLKITEAEQAILSLIAEAIGPDVEPNSAVGELHRIQEAQNRLRHHIRQKLGIPDKETEQ